MIGQTILKQRLNNYDINTFPQSNLIIGEYGSGKHLFIEKVCNKFNIVCEDISDNIEKDFIDDLYLKTDRYIYIIDIIKLSRKYRHINKENVILKFIEEPPVNSIVFIIAENISQVLDTIRNRCVEWFFVPYHVNELMQFKTFDDVSIYDLLDTPGKVINSKEEKYYKQLFELCNSILLNINRANVSNTLSLCKHFIFMNEDKYELRLFLKCMWKLTCTQYLTTYDERHFESSLLINEYLTRTYVLNVTDKNLFNSFILKFKSIYD